MTADLAASIYARLSARAKQRGEDFQDVLTRYGLERFLYRLSVTPARETLWLKGALLFGLWFDVPHRPTRDADFLGFGPADATTLTDAVRAACAAIASLGMTNSRMKDYFDLRALAKEGAVDPGVLAAAIAATFSRRATPLPDGLPLGLTDEFASDALKRSQWSAFLSKNRLDGPSLDVVVHEVRSFVATPLAAASRPRA